jgi:hypothetical protein
VKQVFEVTQAYEMIRFKRKGNHILDGDQFLANLFMPLIETLLEIHGDHVKKRSAEYFNQVTNQKTVQFDEYDLLYT